MCLDQPGQAKAVHTLSSTPLETSAFAPVLVPPVGLSNLPGKMGTLHSFFVPQFALFMAEMMVSSLTVLRRGPGKQGGRGGG